ncbi:MAG: MFS transporter [Micropepsaceae bacterium]
MPGTVAGTVETNSELAMKVKSHRTYALVLLTLAYTSSYLDRTIVGAVAEHIKKDLSLSDTQLGLLTGFAFAIFYATLGIPLAMIADRANRRNIVAGAVAVWSVMTALCGLAGNYWQLVAARIGVGIGEAGSSPQSHSMIADMYAPHERSGALGFYALGVYLGGMLGFLIGAPLAEAWGWRPVFFVVGLPGLLISTLIFFTVSEPPRGLFEGKAAEARKAQDWQETVAALRAAFAFIWHSQACRHVVIGVTLTSFVGYGGVMWAASFLKRTHGISGVEIGLVLGPIVGMLGGFGALLGGYLADRLSRQDKRWNAWVISVAKAIAAPLILGFYLSDSFNLALVFYLPASVLGAFYLGPSFAIVQSVAPVSMRTTVSAIMLFVLNLIALGLGPLAVGMLSDALTPQFGSDALRYALMCTSLLNLWAAYHYFVAGPAYAAEMGAPSKIAV